MLLVGTARGTTYSARARARGIQRSLVLVCRPISSSSSSFNAEAHNGVNE